MSQFDSSVGEFLFSDDGSLLRQDILRWAAWRNHDVSSPEEILKTCEHLFINHSEFRVLVDYRVSQSGKSATLKVLPLFKRATDLYIYCPSIGPGMMIQHGHSTWVMAEKIGSNFLVNQNVTIGVDKGRKPTIGDNVQIRAGAVVVGPITIGDNVTIAPNAFVNFDVPADSVVFPARSVIVSKKKSRVQTEAAPPAARADVSSPPGPERVATETLAAADSAPAAMEGAEVRPVLAQAPALPAPVENPAPSPSIAETPVTSPPAEPQQAPAVEASEIKS